MFIGDQGTGVGSRIKGHSDMAVNGRSSYILSIPTFASQMNITHRKHVYFATPSSLNLPFINASKGRASKPKTRVPFFATTPNVP
jgi:hypothetical protein